MQSSIIKKHDFRFFPHQNLIFSLIFLKAQILQIQPQNITLEQGKTLADAEGDVIRGLQIVEHACSACSLQLGETLPGVSKDMDTYSIR